MGSKKLNFNDTVRRIPQKAMPESALSQGLIMLKLEVQNPEYCGVTAYPYKYLPAMFIKTVRYDNNYGEEGIVMPKGTIVSFITNQTTISSGIPSPTASGTIPQFVDAIDGDLVTTPVDDSFFGYEDSITALMVPCNGGNASQIPYSALDDQLGLWSKSTDDNLQLSANIPVGVVMEDVYQDIRGAYLNYQTHDAYVPVISGRLNIPFVDTTKVAFGSDADVVAGTNSPYTALWRKWAFLRFASGSNEGRSGNLLKSDLYGKFIVQSNSVTATKTAQTVGRILSTDSRFPKELVGMIQNYPGMDLAGVNTAGLPTDLYLFVSETLKTLGLPYDAKTCLQYVQDGAFGYARIQLSVGK